MAYGDGPYAGRAYATQAAASSAPAVSGALGGTVTGPTATLTGTAGAAPVTGTLAGALPSLTATLTGTMIGAAITGTLTGAAPALTGALAGDADTGSSPLTRSDTSDLAGGRTRAGAGEDRTLYPVAAVPPHLSVEPMRIVAHQLPTPTLRNGRPT